MFFVVMGLIGFVRVSGHLTVRTYSSTRTCTCAAARLHRHVTRLEYLCPTAACRAQAPHATTAPLVSTGSEQDHLHPSMQRAVS